MYTLLMPEYNLELHMVEVNKYQSLLQHRSEWGYKLNVDGVEIFTGSDYDCPSNWDSFDVMLDCLDALLDNPKESGSSRYLNRLEREFVESDLACELSSVWSDRQSGEFDDYWEMSRNSNTFTLVNK